MHAFVQHHVTQLPSLRLLLAVLLLTAVVAVLGLSAPDTRRATLPNDAQAVPTTRLQSDSSRLPAKASESVATHSKTKNVQLWASDIMDSHESVPSLAALAKTPSANAKPL